MEVIYGLIPGMIFMGVIAVGILFWAARSGQYDDMEGEAHRILMDDDLEDEKSDPERDKGHADTDQHQKQHEIGAAAAEPRQPEQDKRRMPD